jgi:ribonuclease HI
VVGFSFGKRRAEVTLNLYIDGASRGNPGRASVGAVVLDARGGILSEFGREIGRATNNQAEYRALLHGLDLVNRIADGHPEKVSLVVRSDSELLCRQMSGQYRIKNRLLQELATKARRKLELLDSYSIVSIPRAENKLADRLARNALRDDGR